MRPPGAWVYLVALRYLRARRAHGGSATFLLASLGIAVGTAALIVVLGVMNGFQSGFIDSILEVDSHHIRIKTTGTVADPASTKALASRLTADPRVSAALPFADYEAVALGRSGGALPLRVKAVPQDAALRDPALKIRLSMVEGEFPGRGGLVLGAEIARQLDVFPGDEVSLLSVGASGQEGVTATVVNLRVDGIFRSGHYAFDIGLGFMTFGAAVAFGEPENLVLGVKLRNRFGDESFAAGLPEAYGIEETEIVTWRTYNRSFFGALRMEKTAMMLLVGLIFAVVAVNIFHSMRRTVFEKMEDIAVLKSLGGSSRAVRTIFVLDGLFTGLLGASCGLAAGLAITVNVNEVFAALEAVINAVAQAVSLLAHTGGAGDFQVFSPIYFYLVQIPTRVVFWEILFIFTSGATSAAAAAWAASRRVLAFRPAEVLRNE